MSLLTNLVVFFGCDEAAGANLADSHTGGLTFTQNNSPGTAAGVVGTARTGNGSNRYFSRADSSTFEPGSNSIWACAWIYPTVVGTHAHGIISKYSGSSGWTLRLSATGALNFQARTSAGVTSFKTSASPLTTNTWTFVAGGWDSTVGHSWISVNGSDKSFDTTSIATITATALPAVVGRVTGSTDYFEGRLDQVGLWIGVQPTQSQLAYLYNSGSGRSYTELDDDGSFNQTSDFGGSLIHCPHYLQKALNPSYDLLEPKKRSVYR